MTKASDNPFPSVLFDEQAGDPSTPAAGFWRAYFKSDGIYLIDDAGNVTGPLGEAAPGNIISSSAYASPPASPASGDLWMPTDSYYDFLRYNGSIWVPRINGIDGVLPDNTGFAWVNQGTSSIDTSKGAHVLTTVAGENGSQRIRVKTAPATPYTITAAFRATLIGNQFPAFYLAHRQSSDGKLRLLGVYSDGGANVSVDNWTDHATFSTRPVAAGTAFGSSDVIWLRITDNGTNCIYSISRNGREFVQLYSIGRTTFLTPDQVGWAVRPHASWAAIATMLSWAQT